MDTLDLGSVSLYSHRIFSQQVVCKEVIRPAHSKTEESYRPDGRVINAARLSWFRKHYRKIIVIFAERFSQSSLTGFL